MVHDSYDVWNACHHLLFAMSAPSGVALYWTVSNAYQVLQTYLLNNPFKIIAEREADVQAKKDLEVKKKKSS